MKIGGMTSAQQLEDGIKLPAGNHAARELPPTPIRSVPNPRIIPFVGAEPLPGEKPWEKMMDYDGGFLVEKEST